MDFGFLSQLSIICTLMVFVHSAVKSKIYQEEDKYVELFGNDPADFKAWYTIRNWWYAEGEPSLRKFCAEVHSLAGYGQEVVDFVLYKPRQLNFTNPNFLSRKIDVVEYSIEKIFKSKKTTTTRSWKIKVGGKRWYISQGMRPECVFYLNLVDAQNMVFTLREQVCGIKDISPFTTPNIEELLKEVSPFNPTVTVPEGRPVVVY